MVAQNKDHLWYSELVQELKMNPSQSTRKGKLLCLNNKKVELILRKGEDKVLGESKVYSQGQQTGTPLVFLSQISNWHKCRIQGENTSGAQAKVGINILDVKKEEGRRKRRGPSFLLLSWEKEGIKKMHASHENPWWSHSSKARVFESPSKSVD